MIDNSNNETSGGGVKGMQAGMRNNQVCLASVKLTNVLIVLLQGALIGYKA